jgi:hypothetical protein
MPDSKNRLSSSCAHELRAAIFYHVPLPGTSSMTRAAALGTTPCRTTRRHGLPLSLLPWSYAKRVRSRLGADAVSTAASLPENSQIEIPDEVESPC